MNWTHQLWTEKPEWSCCWSNYRQNSISLARAVMENHNMFCWPEKVLSFLKENGIESVNPAYSIQKTATILLKAQEKKQNS
jgi:isoaspartyl peptidase/L-asparaginase-like protein (Ntn-hydrolase superfamily)